VFLVSGRGELHLTILLETMRREGYELAVSRPRVLFKDINGEKCEPYELLTVDIEKTTRAASWKNSAAAAANCSTWNPTARAACASNTASRRAA
jgi:predicted membrane GTPase involved in stress response